MRNKISTSVTGMIAFRGEEHIRENNCFKLIKKILEKENVIVYSAVNTKIATIMRMYN